MGILKSKHGKINSDWLREEYEQNYPGMLLLIDGSNLSYRVFHKFSELRTPEGLSVGLIYGFLRMLKVYIDKFKPTYLVITFDTKESKESNFRNKLLEDYKSTRKVNLTFDVESFNFQISVIVNILKKLKIHVIRDREGLGFEADDYIAYCALRHAKETNKKVTIISSDKDFCQLIDNRIRIFNPFKETIISGANCKEVMGYKPEECVDYLTLTGDKSDNIPGYKGVGDKGARAFLDNFGSIKGFLAKDLENAGKICRVERNLLKIIYKRNKKLIDLHRVARKIKKVPITLYDDRDVDWVSVDKTLMKFRLNSMLKKEFKDTFSYLKIWVTK